MSASFEGLWSVDRDRDQRTYRHDGVTSSSATVRSHDRDNLINGQRQDQVNGNNSR